jgi:hypothetical protein
MPFVPIAELRVDVSIV